MNFARRDAGRRAAVNVALQEADGLLLRRIITERIVHVAVDEAGACRRAVRVDQHVAGIDFARNHASHRRELAVIDAYRIAVYQRIAPVASAVLMTGWKPRLSLSISWQNHRTMSRKRSP